MTKRKPSSSKGLAAALLGWVLLGAFALGAPPVEAAKKTHASKKNKPHKPSKAHLKLRSALDKAQAENIATGSELGAASFYGFGFQGRRVATGERFDARLLTAASNRYPLGSWVAVRRLDNERCVVVKVNDRMHSKHRTRIIDLSRSAAEQLRMISAGVVLVRVARLAEAPSEEAEIVCRKAFANEVGVPPTCVDCQSPPLEMPPPLLPNIGESPQEPLDDLSIPH